LTIFFSRDFLQSLQLLHILVAKLIFSFEFSKKSFLILLSRNLPPFLIHHIHPKLIATVMFEITFTSATKRTKETRNISNPIRVSLIMLPPVKVRIIQIFNNLTIINISYIMLTLTVVIITGAREITVLRRSGHSFIDVIVN